MIPGTGFIIWPIASAEACDLDWNNVVLAMHLDSAIQSALAIVVADGKETKFAAEWDIAEASEPTWDSYFSEYGTDAALSYVGGSGVSTEDTGVVSTKTLDFDRTLSYRINCNNTSWIGDLANLDLEFLDASNAVVCAVRNIDSSYDYASDLFYGANLSSLTQTSQAHDTLYNFVTVGYITFTDTAIIFTSTASSEGYGSVNMSFSFNCAANTITQVRISNARAKSNYTGGTGGAAWVSFYKRKTFTDLKGHVVTPYGGITLTTDTGPYGTGNPSAVFTDVPDTRLQVTPSTDFDIGTADFNVKFWVYVGPSTARSLFSTIDSHTESWNNAIHIHISNVTAKLLATVYDAAGSYTTISAADVFPGNTWVLVEFLRNSGVYYLLQDKVVVGSASPALITHASSGLTIGNSYDSSNNLVGRLAEVVFTIGNSRLADTTLPTAPFAEVAC